MINFVTNINDSWHWNAKCCLEWLTILMKDNKIISIDKNFSTYFQSGNVC